MKIITEKEGVFYYYNKWEAKFGGKMSPIISTEWIYTDQDLEKFQKWLDKKRGE